MAVSDVGIGLAAVGALAAAWSARSSARGVELGHRPYVYGERENLNESTIGIRLRNDGPGMAAEVRYRLGAPGVPPTEWSSPVRALQPGEIHPPEGKDPSEAPQLPTRGDKPVRDWYIETAFSDIAGTRWRLRNERAEPSAAARARRLRSHLIDVWRPRAD
jgi:hypothetical protein